MKRRQFIKYSSLGAAALGVTACSHSQGDKSPTFSPTDLGKLEKSNLIMAYVPTTDAAPLIIAQEKDFFSRYGLKVSFSKQTNSDDIEKGLLSGKFDAAQVPYPLPLLAQLGKNPLPIISLMTLSGNGSAITLPAKAWQAGLRPGHYYQNFAEFGDNYRNYLRKFDKAPTLATESATSLDGYLYRYWLGAMGINPSQEVKWISIAPSQLMYKLQAGIINGYSVGEPWNQIAVAKKVGFVPYTTRDIWQGHPSKVLGVTQSWVDKNPTTSRALIAGLLSACQFCEQEQNQTEVAQILAKSQYINVPSSLIESALGENYHYEQLEQPLSDGTKIADLSLFHGQKSNYLQKLDHINYPWRSHGVWLLTQLVRWQQLGLSAYPRDADSLLDRVYPLGIYEEVAKGLKIELPSDRLKIEPKTTFIDQREFDPSQPVAYLNQFAIRNS